MFAGEHYIIAFIEKVSGLQNNHDLGYAENTLISAVRFNVSDYGPFESIRT